MKIFKKSVITTLTLISALTLGACSNNDSFALELENTDGGFITADSISVSTQEAFEAMATSFDNNAGVNNGVLTLLDLVDLDLLDEQFEIDESEIESTIEDYRRETGDDYENFLISAGFETEDDLVDYLRLLSLRNAAAREAIEITEEDIEEAYELIRNSEQNNQQENTEDADDDDDTDNDADADEEEEEFPDLEEVRDEIEESLIRQQLTPKLIQSELARLRNEAGFTILDAYLQEQYINLLEVSDVDADEVYSQNSRTEQHIAATVGEKEYTSDQLFEALIPSVGLSTGIELVDPIILGAIFEVEDSEIKEIVDNVKIELGEQFYPTFQRMGYNSDQEIFDYLTFIHLQTVAFEEEYNPTDERLEEIYAELLESMANNISTRHILVDDEDLAKELITELEEANDVEARFAELAEEHSTCPSASEGGNLNPFDPHDPQGMVAEFSAAALELDIDTFSTEPVETEFGYHIIYRYENEEAPAFEDISEELFTQELTRLRTEERREAVLVEHREAANFTFEDESLQSRYNAIVDNILEALAESEAPNEDEDAE